MQQTTLFVVLLLIIGQTLLVDSYSRKGSSALDSKDRANPADADDSTDLSDDDYPAPTSSRRNRYSSHASSGNNHRGRSRWPANYDDAQDSNDWSRFGFGLNNLLSSFPGASPPAVFDNGPTCLPLLDAQYQLFSDVCGAVPQARYSLPNAFGHVERWQIAQLLTMILGPAAPAASNPSCTRSLRLLICPLLFPSCSSRYEASPVLPCQPFCRVVKNQCPSPALDLLPCDILPLSSELCPVNPSPYSSLLASFAQQHQMPMNNGLFPGGLSPSTLSSLLAQSALSGGFPSSAMASYFNQGGFPSPSGYPQISSPFDLPPAAQSRASINQFNPNSFASESLSPILVDFPPVNYGNDYRQTGRAYPATRSATEKV